MSWEAKAEILYKDTKWLKQAKMAGRSIDNRLNQVIGKIQVETSRFDMEQYLAFFDYEVLVRRKLDDRIRDSIIHNSKTDFSKY